MRALPALVLAISACSTKEPATKPFNPPPGETHAESTPTQGNLDFASKAEAPRGAPDQVGLATWYGAELAGRKTASGERFDPRAMTAAHRKLPLGTWVEVRRPDTGRSIRVKINDRGPWGDERKIIDLSRKAAEALDIIGRGVMKVELRVVSRPD
jgi:rare lipoprotein A (peptidoglycan hydrolase)